MLNSRCPDYVFGVSAMKGCTIKPKDADRPYQKPTGAAVSSSCHIVEEFHDAGASLFVRLVSSLPSAEYEPGVACSGPACILAGALPEPSARVPDGADLHAELVIRLGTISEGWR